MKLCFLPMHEWVLDFSIFCFIISSFPATNLQIYYDMIHSYGCLWRIQFQKGVQSICRRLKSRPVHTKPAIAASSDELNNSSSNAVWWQNIRSAIRQLTDSYRLSIIRGGLGLPFRIIIYSTVYNYYVNLTINARWKLISPRVISVISKHLDARRRLHQVFITFCD